MNNIRSIRTRHDVTQAELADKLNITRAALSQYENGRRRLDPEVAKQIADIFEVSLDDVYGYTPVQDKKEALPPEGNSAKIARIMELLEEQPESVQTMVLGMLEAASPKDGESDPE